MSRIPPVTHVAPPTAHQPPPKKPEPPPSTSVARGAPFQGTPPKIGLGFSLKI